jgi:Glyoxalase/Bleomycin resistance protein/Dioxygenase superfamily
MSSKRLDRRAFLRGACGVGVVSGCAQLLTAEPVRAAEPMSEKVAPSTASYPFTKYTQICHVVHDMKKSIMNFVALGAGPFYTIDSSQVPERNYRGHIGRDDTFDSARGFLNAVQIEIVQPINNAPSLFREILDTKGETVHHYQPTSRARTPTEYDAEYARFAGMGLKPVLTFVHGGRRSAFFDGQERFGFFIELNERDQEEFHLNRLMYEEHLTWDGHDPIRTWDSFRKRHLPGARGEKMRY